MSLTDLKKRAKEMGVKYYSSKIKKQICGALGILDQKRSNKYFFKEIKTGEEFGFPSTCNGAKEMGVFSTQITWKPIYVKNLETGEEKEYKSAYAAMKDLGVTVVIYQYAKLQTPMKIGGVKFKEVKE